VPALATRGLDIDDLLTIAREVPAFWRYDTGAVIT